MKLEMMTSIHGRGAKVDAVPDGVFCTKLSKLSFLRLICEINLNFILFFFF